MASDLAINVVVRNGASGELKAVENDLNNVGKAGEKAGASLAGIGKNLSNVGKGLTAAVTLPLLGIGAAAIQASSELNKGMANVQSLGVATARVNELKGAVQDLAIATGKSTTDLANGLYQVVSAFGDTADTSKILEISAKSAAAGVADTTDAINLLSAVTKGYGDTSAEAVQKTSDLALKTVELGQTTFPELAASIGKVTVMSSSLGIKQTELFSVFSSLTGVVGGAAEVSTGYRGILQALQSPTDTMTKLLNSMGFASGAAMIKQYGLEKSIQVISAAAQGSGLPLQSFISSVEGQNAAMALAGAQSGKYASDLAAMGNATGKTDAAFKAQTEGVNAAGFALQQLKTMGQVFLQDVGDALGPTLLRVADSLQPLVDHMLTLSTQFKNMSPDTQAWIIGMMVAAAAIGPLLIGIGALLPVLGTMGAALAAIVSPLGLVAIGLGALVYYNFDSIKGFAANILGKIASAAPSAGAALGELVAQLTGIGIESYDTTEGIQSFVTALTGSSAAGTAAANWIADLGDKVANIQKSFSGAGGGISGFVAALGTLTGGTVGVDLKAQVETIRWGDFVGILDWGKYVFQVRWTDFVAVVDWSKSIGILKWGDYTYRLDWSLYITALSWLNIVAVFAGWDNYVEHLTWKQFVSDLMDWSPYIAKLTWDSFIVSVQLGQFVTKIAWTEFIAPLAWSAIVTIVDWNQYIAKLAWSEFVSKFTWQNATAINWTEFVPKLAWVQYVTPVGWLNYIALLTWDTYVKPLSWTQLADKLSWIQFIAPLGWLTYIAQLSWDKFVVALPWGAYLEKLTWSSFVGSMSWADFIEKLAWSAFLPQFAWANFVTGIDLRSYVPSFPGWAALVSSIPGAGAIGNAYNTITGHAAGTTYAPGGWSWVGERGPELMKIPRGSQIMSNAESSKYIANNAEGTTTAGETIPASAASLGLGGTQAAGFNNFVASMNKTFDTGSKKLQAAIEKGSQALEGALGKVPGLFGSSEVTQKQMDMAKLGVPQNFADDYLRRLTDSVLNGKKWDGVDIKDAAKRAGIDPTLPAKVILDMVKEQWNTQEFFAGGKNTELINMDAVKKSIAQQQAQASGHASVLALFGIKSDDVTAQGGQIVDLLNQGIAKGLTIKSKDGKGGAGAGTGIGSAIVSGAVNDIKDSKIDVGAQFATALNSQLTSSDAFSTTGAAILKKIVASWGESTKSVNMLKGIADALRIQTDSKDAVELLKNVGGKIAQLLKQGIDDYFQSTSVADSVSKGVKKASDASSKAAVPAHNAIGTNWFNGGLTWVGESGAELISLPRGSGIYPQRQLAASGGNITVNVNANVSSDIDVNSLAYRIAEIISRKR